MNGHKNGEQVRDALLAFGCEIQSLLVLGSWFSWVRNLLDIECI